MPWFGKAVIIFMSLYVGVEMQISLKSNQISSKKWILKKDDIVVVSAPITGENEKFYYLACRYTNTSELEMNCNINAESSNLSDKDQHKTCSVDLQYGDNFTVADEDLTLRLLGNNKLIVAFLGNQNSIYNLKATVVDMNDCKIVKNNIVLKEVEVNFQIIPYEDTFDIFVINNDTCNGKFCKTTYNTSGKQIGNPVEILPNESLLIEAVPIIKPIASQSSSKGYFAFIDSVHYHESFTVLSVNPDGKVKTSTNLPTENELYYQYFLSREYEFFSICWMHAEAKKISCTQLDENLNVKINVTLNVMNNEYEVPKAVYNLKDGGLLLWTIIESPDNLGISRIYKIDLDGQHKQYVISEGLYCIISMYRMSHYYIYENKNEYCFLTQCGYESDNDDGDKKLIVKCVPKKVIH